MTLTPETIEQMKAQLQGLSPEEQQKKFQEIVSTLSPEDQEQLIGKQQCPFCLMVQGEIPVKKIYDDDTLLGILDINPANNGHTLLFPKEHHRVLSTVPQALVAHLFTVANSLSTAVFDAMQAQGTNILVANGPAAGQTAPHVLVNIIPRYAKDPVSIAWKGHKEEESQMESIAEKIKTKIPKEKAKIPQKKESSPFKESYHRIP